MQNFNVIEQLDDLIKCYAALIDNTCEVKFMQYLDFQSKLSGEHYELNDECKRLKGELDAANKNLSALEIKVSDARRLMLNERAITERIRQERDLLKGQLEQVKKFVFNADHENDLLKTISSSSSSVCHDSLTDNRLDKSRLLCSDDEKRICYIQTINVDGTEPLFEKNGHIQTDDITVVTQTTIHCSPQGDPTSMESVIHSFSACPKSPCEPKKSDEEHVCTGSSIDAEVNSVAANKENIPSHKFLSKHVYMSGQCACCEKKIYFGSRAGKCIQCGIFTHFACKDKIRLPCLTHKSKQQLVSTLNDYAPLTPPMVPFLVVHCINEIEQRGISEKGLYRVSGSEKDIRSLKEKFLRAKANGPTPDLSTYDIHAVCGFLKDFFCSLGEPVIPKDVFSEAFDCSVVIEDETAESKSTAVREIISRLPQPNRDTLAFLMLHLKRVAASAEAGMSPENLAIVFAFSITGKPSAEDDPLAKTNMAISVVRKLLELPSDYWSNFIIDPAPSVQLPLSSVKRSASAEITVRKTSRLFTTKLKN